MALPTPVFANPVPVRTSVPIVRNWIAAANLSEPASNPADWSPTGLPQPGDVLTMQHSGTMNVTGNVLQGDTLLLGVQGQTADMTLNVSQKPQVTLEPVKGAPNQVSINVDPNDTALVKLLDGGFEGETNFDINLATGASVQNNDHFDLTQSTVHLNGGLSFINNAEVTLHQAGQLWTYTDVQGTGQMTVGDPQWGGAIAYFDKGVASGQTINVVGAPSSTVIEGNTPFTPTPSNLIVNDPRDFHAKVNLDFGSLSLHGVQADSYSLQNDILSLISKGIVLDRVGLTTVGATDPLKVYQTNAGVLIDNSNHPVGTLLPLH